MKKLFFNMIKLGFALTVNVLVVLALIAQH